MVEPFEPTLTPTLLKDCQEQESATLDQLRAALVCPSAATTQQSLISIVDRLMDTLAQHLIIASEGGYMSEIAKERPSWHRRINSLHGANVWCISSLAGLRDDLERQSPTDLSTLTTQMELQTWMHSLASIRECEALVLQRAYCQDIGGEA